MRTPDTCMCGPLWPFPYMGGLSMWVAPCEGHSVAYSSACVVALPRALASCCALA